MPKMGKKQAVERSCLEMTLERMGYVFDSYDHVAISFSGGKDSTACLNIALQVAREKGRLPLCVFTFDEEAIPPETVEYMARVAANPEIDFRWYCVPIEHRNACSTKQPYWYPWAPEDQERWVRDLPPLAITDYPGFRRDGIAQQVPRLFSPERGTLANVMGIRTQESMTRYRHIASKRGHRAFLVRMADTPHVTNVMPIYDWSTEDVWLAPSLFGWDYNRAYDVMEQYGITRHMQRCAPPYGEQPIRGLAKFKACWPELWAKMTERVHGAATAARYANTELYGCAISDEDLPEGMTWRELTLKTLKALPPESRQEASAAIEACMTSHGKRSKAAMPDDTPDALSGFCWKTLYIAARVGGDKFGRQSQKMQNKARHERMRRGITE